jgi:hypothetical protein
MKLPLKMHTILLKQITSNARRYWPMRIVEGNSIAGFRIGGYRPIGVQPRITSELTLYFGTFPIRGHREEELSIFTGLKYSSPNDPLFLTKHIYRCLGAEDEVLQCVFHDPSNRGNDSRFASELQPYAVGIGDESVLDPDDPRTGAPHRIGGMPFLRYEKPSVCKISDDLLGAGYVHLLQWSYPTGNWDCSVKGLWPFANYQFHLYLKETVKGYDYKALLV